MCHTGWTGKRCTLDGCPAACSGHGLCTNTSGNWACHCRPGWAGQDCAVRLEQNCGDGEDNDQGENGLEELLNLNK